MHLIKKKATLTELAVWNLDWDQAWDNYSNRLQLLARYELKVLYFN